MTLPDLLPTAGPLAGLFADLNAEQSSITGIIGDSTAYSAWDTGFSEYPWTPGTLYGWVGRLFIAIGDYYDVNVEIRLLNYPNNVTYLNPVTVRSSDTNPDTTITVYLGGWPGATIADYLGSLAGLLPVADLSALIIQDGFNEPTTTTFTTNYSTLIGNIHTTYCPTTPIVVTTANTPTAIRENGHTVTFAQLFAAMTTLFLPGETLPLTPTLQASTAFTNVWVIDTRQAPITADDLHDDDGSVYPAGTGIHPLASGFDKQAALMFDALFTAWLPATGQTSGDYGWLYLRPAKPSSILPWSIPFEIGGPIGHWRGTYGFAAQAYGRTTYSGTASGAYSWGGHAAHAITSSPSSILPWTLPFEIGGPTGHTVGAFSFAVAAQGTTTTSGAATATMSWVAHPQSTGGVPNRSSELPWTLPFTLGAAPLPDYARTQGAYGWATETVTGIRNPAATHQGVFGWAALVIGTAKRQGATAATIAWSTESTGTSTPTLEQLADITLTNTAAAAIILTNTAATIALMNQPAATIALVNAETPSLVMEAIS